MTEADWLTSADPARMLRWLCAGDAVTKNRWSRMTGLSRQQIDRQLHLWVEACRERLSSRERIPTKWSEIGSVLGGPLANFLDTWSSGKNYSIVPLAERCDILRDIIGNPFRPVTVSSSWLTWNYGAIPRLAEEAYQERVTKKCEKKCNWPRKCTWCGSSKPCSSMDCPQPLYCHDCDCTGTIATGDLDPTRLAMIADALEEAGCATQRGPVSGTPQQLLAYLLDVKEVDSLKGVSIYQAGPNQLIDDRLLCDLAKALQSAWNSERNISSKKDLIIVTHVHTDNQLSSSFQVKDGFAKPGEPMAWLIHLNNEVADRVIREVAGDLLLVDHPHPLLTHLRSAGPHVRGCWAVDRLRGVK